MIFGKWANGQRKEGWPGKLGNEYRILYINFSTFVYVCSFIQLKVKKIKESQKTGLSK